MASYHDGQRDWLEAADKVLMCSLAGCAWAFVTSGIDTRGDVHDTFMRHLQRHDEELSKELDAL